MDTNDYQRRALAFANPAMLQRGRIEQLTNAALGLAGEAGEVADVVKKVAYHDLPLADHEDALIKELGDIAWYLALAADALHYDLATVLSENLTKLRNRHPSGQFTNAYHAARA